MIGSGAEAPPRDFKHVYGPEWRLGSLQLFAREAPPTFWVEARGFIVPRLVRVDLEYAGAFGRLHPEGWDYVVDARGVRVVHPWNLVELRQVRRMPNLRSWIVIAGSGFATALLRAAPPALRPDLVVRSSREAHALLEAGAEKEGAPTTRRENRT